MGGGEAMTPQGIRVTRLDGFNRGKVLEFSGPEVSIGTDAGCDIRYDPVWDKAVSPRHAVLRWKGRDLELADNSRAGIWSGGRKLVGGPLAGLPVVLELGEGGAKLKIEWKAVEAPGAVVPPHSAERSAPQSLPSEPLGKRVGDPVAKPYRRNSRPVWAVVSVAVLAIAVLGAAGVWFVRGLMADQALADAAARNAAAVGVVVATGPGGPEAFGTAWALGDRVFATNAHVARPVGEAIQQGAVVHVVLNRNPQKKFRVTRAVPHAAYEEAGLGPDGRPSAVPINDVGLLEVDGELPVAMRIAPREELEKLRSGYRVAYMGFPCENLAGGGVDPNNPVATMQSGIVTSVTDWWLGQADFAKSLLVQHNLGATGGASGSPIFNTRGEVVAVLSAGNIIEQVRVDANGNTHIERAPSAAMVNFAQRADLLETFIDKKNRTR